jgi:hypothetical protein
MAMTVNALTGAGAAGVLGGIPGASAMGANAALEIAADLQRQQAARDQFVAAAQQDIEGRRVKAEREMIGDQLAGAQLQAYTSGTEKNQAIATGVKAIGGAAAAEIGAQPLYKEVPDPVIGPDTVRESQYYQFEPKLAPEGVMMPKEDKTKIITTSQPTTNFSGDMYSGLGLDKQNMITFR